VLVVSVILVVGYAYIAARLTSTAPVRAALAAPFIMVWILPVVYWFGDRSTACSPRRPMRQTCRKPARCWWAWTGSGGLLRLWRLAIQQP